MGAKEGGAGPAGGKMEAGQEVCGTCHRLKPKIFAGTVSSNPCPECLQPNVLPAASPDALRELMADWRKRGLSGLANELEAVLNAARPVIDKDALFPVRSKEGSSGALSSQSIPVDLLSHPDALRVREAWEQLKAIYSDCPYCDSEWPEHALGDDCPYKVLEAALASSSGAGVQVTGEQVKAILLADTQRRNTHTMEQRIEAFTSDINAALSRQSQPSYVEVRSSACRAGSDGDCDWEACPQELNGRSNYQATCPLLKQPAQTEPAQPAPAITPDTEEGLFNQRTCGTMAGKFSWRPIAPARGERREK